MGTRIGGTYVSMPFIAWLFVAPIIFSVWLMYYMVYGAVLGCMMAGRWYIERREQGRDD